MKQKAIFGIAILILSIAFLGCQNYASTYLSNEVNTSLESINKEVGDDKVYISYKGINTGYNLNGEIDSIIVLVTIEVPKDKNYTLSADLLTKPKFENGVGGNVLSTWIRPIYLEANKTNDIKFVFNDTDEIHKLIQLKYEDIYYFSMRAWMRDLTAKRPFGGGTIDSWPMKITDAGNSKNMIISGLSGQMTPYYYTEKFSLQNNKH